MQLSRYSRPTLGNFIKRTAAMKTQIGSEINAHIYNTEDQFFELQVVHSQISQDEWMLSKYDWGFCGFTLIFQKRKLSQLLTNKPVNRRSALN